MGLVSGSGMIRIIQTVAMERKFETMVRWRAETIVQWIDRFEAPLSELDVARDGLNPYEEDELIYL